MNALCLKGKPQITLLQQWTDSFNLQLLIFKVIAKKWCKQNFKNTVSISCILKCKILALICLTGFGVAGDEIM